MPCAVRAPTAVLSTGSHGRLPRMAQRIPPPHPAVAVRGDSVRCQAPVLLHIPLGGDSRELTFQIVFSGDYQLPRADRAARPAGGPGADLCLPYVPFGTQPPDLAGVSGYHVPGRQITVFRRMPLLRQLRVGGGKIVDPLQQDPVSTDGTAATAQRAGFNDGLPLVALFADPPCLEVAPHGDALRYYGQVFGRVPLFQQVRPLGGQIVFPRPRLLSGAVGTAAALGTGIDRRLPRVSLGAKPPDLLSASVGHVPWRQRSIFNRVPLGQQGQFVPLHAVVIERCA